MNINWDVKELPHINSEWEHHNGGVYTVVLHANVCSEKSAYEPTVVYRSENGNIWCMQLSGWHKSFKPFKSDKEKWIDQAIKIAARSVPECDVTFSNAIYEALASGELPMPKVKK